MLMTFSEGHSEAAPIDCVKNYPIKLAKRQEHVPFDVFLEYLQLKVDFLSPLRDVKIINIFSIGGLFGKKTIEERNFIKKG